MISFCSWTDEWNKLIEREAGKNAENYWEIYLKIKNHFRTEYLNFRLNEVTYEGRKFGQKLT